jgi:hypothetical protein
VLGLIAAYAQVQAAQWLKFLPPNLEFDKWVYTVIPCK